MCIRDRSNISWVKNVSIKPTSDIANDVGNITPKVERLNGTFPFANSPNGKDRLGNPFGNVPKSLTVGISNFKNILIKVSKIIATNWEGITFVILGNP